MGYEEVKKHGVENSWSKIYSFTLALEGTLNMSYYTICILDNRRILMANPTYQLIYVTRQKIHLENRQYC